MHRSSGIFVCISIPHLHRNSRLQHTTILDVALGENLYSDGPDRWGSLCLYASAGILLHKLNDHCRQGDKEDDTDDAKELSTDHSSHKGVQRRKPHGFSHHPGVDELVFNKLYGKVNNETAHGQNGIHQQHEEHADHAGDQRSDVGG